MNNHSYMQISIQNMQFCLHNYTAYCIHRCMQKHIDRHTIYSNCQCMWRYIRFHSYLNMMTNNLNMCYFLKYLHNHLCRMMNNKSMRYL